MDKKLPIMSLLRIFVHASSENNISKNKLEKEKNTI